MSVFRKALDKAVEDEIIEKNILYGKKIIRKTKIVQKDKIIPFTENERRLIIASAGDGQFCNLIEFSFWTGLRISELCAINWSDIDFDKKQIRVNKALTQHASEVEATKTVAGTRMVKLLDHALKALKSQKIYTLLKGEEVFQNPKTGKRWTGDLAIRQSFWIPFLRKAGVAYRYPYQMRHTYVSMMLMAGESVMWVSSQLGHTDWSFTARTYSRFLSDDAPKSGELAEKMWGS